jgi:hypothetical protein
MFGSGPAYLRSHWPSVDSDAEFKAAWFASSVRPAGRVAAAIGVIALAGSPVLRVAASETPTSAIAKAGQGMTDAPIQTDLQSEGYGDVRITGRTCGHVDITATRNGLLQKFAAAPRTGAKVPDAARATTSY